MLGEGVARVGVEGLGVVNVVAAAVGWWEWVWQERG